MDNKRILLECNLVYDLFFQERKGACSFDPLPTSTYPRSAIGKDCKITQITIFIWHILTQINYHHFRLASRIVSKVIFMLSKTQKLEFWVLKLIVELLNCTLGTPNFCRPAGHGLLGAFWILQCDYIDLLDWVKLRTLYLAPIDGLQITVRHDVLLGTPRGVVWYPPRTHCTLPSPWQNLQQPEPEGSNPDLWGDPWQHLRYFLLFLKEHWKKTACFFWSYLCSQIRFPDQGVSIQIELIRNYFLGNSGGFYY